MPKFFGKRVKRVTNGAFFPEGRDMLVWDYDKHLVYVRKVYYIIAPEFDYPFPVITYDSHHKSEAWVNCAYIPKGLNIEPENFPNHFDDT